MRWCKGKPYPCLSVEASSRQVGKKWVYRSMRTRLYFCAPASTSFGCATSATEARAIIRSSPPGFFLFCFSCCGLRKPRRQVARCSHMLCRRFFCWPSCVEKIPHISPFQPGPLVPSPAPPEVVECLVRRRGGKCAASLSKELRRLHLCQQPSLQAEASVSPTEKEKAEKGQQRAGAQRQEEAGHKAISSEGKDSRDDDGRKSRGRPQQQPQQIGRPALERRPSRGGDDCCDGALPVTNSIVGKGSVPVDRRQKPQAETLHPSKGFLSGSSASDLNSSRLVEAARTLYDAGEEVFFDAQGNTNSLVVFSRV